MTLSHYSKKGRDRPNGEFRIKRQKSSCLKRVLWQHVRLCLLAHKIDKDDKDAGSAQLLEASGFPNQCQPGVYRADASANGLFSGRQPAGSGSEDGEAPIAPTVLRSEPREGWAASGVGQGMPWSFIGAVLSLFSHVWPKSALRPPPLVMQHPC